MHSLLRFFKFPYNFFGDFRRTCNPHDNYMHFTGYVLQLGDPPALFMGEKFVDKSVPSHCNFNDDSILFSYKCVHPFSRLRCSTSVLVFSCWLMNHAQAETKMIDVTNTAYSLFFSQKIRYVKNYHFE